jgi:serine/threonine-protein phosphatase 2A regulatory subunit B''
MESASQAPVTFSDVMCQMQDMLNPEVPECFTLRDLRKSRSLAGAMFNILFNLGKFVAYETRDPFVVRQVRYYACCHSVIVFVAMLS